MNTVEMAEFASEQIRRAIITGRYKPGERLREKQLSESLNVSRHPVRDALRLLEREGFIDLVRNKGATVRAVEAGDVIEVYNMRMALGRIALDHLMAEGRAFPAESLARLQEMASRALAFAELENQAQTVQNDLAFQQEIINATGLHRTIRYFSELTGDVRRFNNLLGVVYTDRAGDARKYVQGLFEAIQAGDREIAQAIWNTKFTKALERYLLLLENMESPGASRKAAMQME